MRRFRQHHRKTQTKSGKAMVKYKSPIDNNPRYELWAALPPIVNDELTNVPTDRLSMSLADLESMTFPFTLPGLSFLDMSTPISIPFDYSWTGQGGDENDLSFSMPTMSTAVDEDVDFWEVFSTFQPTAEPTAQPTTVSTIVSTIGPTAEQITEPPQNDVSAPTDQEELNAVVPDKVTINLPPSMQYYCLFYFTNSRRRALFASQKYLSRQRQVRMNRLIRNLLRQHNHLQIKLQFPQAIFPMR
jgi:hypothetical protein